MCNTPSRHIIAEWFSAPMPTRGLTRGQTTTLRCDAVPHSSHEIVVNKLIWLGPILLLAPLRRPAWARMQAEPGEGSRAANAC